MSVIDVTNPGLVNVADQGYDSVPRPDQPVTVTSPSQTAVITRRAGDGSQVDQLSVDQSVTVGPSQNAGENVNGGSFEPGGVPREVNAANRIANQVPAGTGLPANVFV